MNRPYTLILACLLVVNFPVALQAETVIHHPEPAKPLAQRWNWALQKARQSSCRDGCWVGYSISRGMQRHAYIGNYDSDAAGRKSLSELIYGNDVESIEARQPANSKGKVIKQIALLFRLAPQSVKITAVNFGNLSQTMRLDGAPLLWLGHASNAQSIALLGRLYKQAHWVKLKKNLTAALGLHRTPARVVPFLREVLIGRAASEVRETAVFWLGEQGTPEALTLLKYAARHDRSQAVREKAVFGISLINGPEATDALVELTQSAEDQPVREKAIFWLGQRASQKAAAGLEDVVRHDPDAKVRERAVFALSRLPSDKAIPRLIKIARTNPNPEVRKRAIFWLGQSGGTSAVRALAAIARGQ